MKTQNINIKNLSENKKKWGKLIIIILILIGLLVLGSYLFGSKSGKIDLSDVSTEAVSGADLRMAVLRMDLIQEEATVLKDLRNQRESMEKKLKSEFERTQKALESEKKEIESEQSVLSREALSKKINEYQNKVANFQRSVAEKAQGLETAYQKALSEIQKDHLDPVVDAISEKKQLDLVLDGRFSKVSKASATKLDITPDVINVLNKKVSKVHLGSI